MLSPPVSLRRGFAIRFALLFILSAGVTRATSPIAVDDTLTVDEEGSGTIDVVANDYDPDGDTPRFHSITKRPAHGTVTATATGTVTYAPNPDFFGVDVFEYYITDGKITHSDGGRVVVTVRGINDAPVGVDDAVATDEETRIDIDVLANDTDVDGDTLTITAVTAPVDSLQPARTAGVAGTVTVGGVRVIRFTPATNYTGEARFSYTLSDGQGGTDTASAAVTVNPANDAPTALADTYTLAEDGSLSVPAGGVLANDGDVDGDPLVANVVTDVANGVLQLNADGSFTYTPAADFNGTDRFSYTAFDGAATSAPALATLTVTPVNDAPTGSDLANVLATEDDGTLPDIDLYSAFSDPEDSAAQMTYAVTANSLPGLFASTRIVNNRFLRLVLANDGAGIATLVVSATDTGGLTARAELFVGVTQVNDAPMATADSYITAEDTPLAVPAPGVLANDTDVDGDARSASLVGDVSNGTLQLAADGSFLYTPGADFNGTDQFTYSVSDGTLTSSPTPVTLTITAVNDAPVASGLADLSVVEDAGTLADIDLHPAFSDQEDNAVDMTYALTSNSAPNLFSSAQIVANQLLRLTLADDQAGTATIGITATDSGGLTARTNLLVDVTQVNDAPVAVADTYTTSEGIPLVVPAASGLLQNDTDADPNDNLQVVRIETLPQHGALLQSNPPSPDGSFTYTPAADFVGTDWLAYVVNDGTADSNVALVTITVEQLNVAPRPGNDTANTPEGRTVIVDVLANDTDDDGDTLQVVDVYPVAVDNQGGNGGGDGTPTSSQFITAEQKLSVTPALGFVGVLTLEYVVADGNGGEATALLRVSVSATVTDLVNDPPALVEGVDLTLPAVDEDEEIPPLDLYAYFDDPDDTDDTLTFEILSRSNPDLFQTLTLVPDVKNDHVLRAVLAPDENTTQNGVVVPATVRIRVTDPGGLSVDAEFSITVNPVNDPPVAVDDPVTVSQDTSIQINPLANDMDPDGDTLDIILLDQAAIADWGTIEEKPAGSNVFVFTPYQGFHGSVDFDYQVVDYNAGGATPDDAGFDIGRVTLTMTPKSNTPPVARSDSYTLNLSTGNVLTLDLPISVLANDYDAEDDLLVAYLRTGGNEPAADHGTISLFSNGTLVYTRTDTFVGQVEFLYSVYDGLEDSVSPARVFINLHPDTNAVPLVQDDAYNVVAGAALSVFATGDPVHEALLANDSDADGDSLTLLVDSVALADPAKGELTVRTDGSFTFIPAAGVGETGDEDVTFTYRVSDGVNESAPGTPATVTITVKQPPQSNRSLRFVSGASFDLELAPGWNLVSLPLTPLRYRPEEVFGDAVILPLWTWDSDAAAYVELERVYPKVAFWVFRPGEPVTLTVEGLPAYSGEKALSRDWNLVGASSLDPWSVAAICPDEQTRGSVRLPLLGYDTGSGRYVEVTEADQIVPGRGYWLNSDDDGVRIDLGR